MILKEVPHAQVETFVGRDDSFEIIVDNQLIFSKLQLRIFPSFKKVKLKSL